MTIGYTLKFPKVFSVFLSADNVSISMNQMKFKLKETESVSCSRVKVQD